MAHLIDRFRAALVLCPNASGAIGDTQGNPLFCLETPDVNELVAALVQSAKYPEVAKDAEDRLSSIWLHVAEKAKLTEERDALAAKLAEVTSGEPFAWGRMVDGKPAGVSYAGDARSGHYDIPLFRAVSSDAELRDLLAREQRMREATRLELVESQEKERAGLEAIAKARAGIGKLTEERDAWQLSQGTVAREKAALQKRVDSLVAGERLTRDALAAAEKDRDQAQRDAREWEEQTQREQASAARAEARVKALESSAEPFAWGFEHVDPNGRVIPYARTAKSNANAEAGILGGHEVFPLYRHPPKPAAETKHYPAWETSGGPNECPHGYAAGIPCQRCDVAKAKPAGEPVAWQANPQPGLIGAITPDKAIAERWASKGLVVRALYKAPPAAQAIGVTDERFIALGTNDSCVRALGIPNSARIVGTRAEVDAAIRASLGDSRWLRQTYEPVRVVPIGSPTVRLDLLHALIAKAEAGGFTIQPSSIRAAIGEKGG